MAEYKEYSKIWNIWNILNTEFTEYSKTKTGNIQNILKPRTREKSFTVKPGEAYPLAQEPINEFIIRKLNPLLVVDFRLISTFLHV